MTKLTDTQALILTSAAQHPDGIAAPPASLPPAPRGAVARAMLKAGLLEVAEDADAQHAGLAWKLDGKAVFLRISAVGRTAIGSVAETIAEDAQEAPLAAPDAEQGYEAPCATEPAHDAPTGLLEASAPEPADAATTGPQDGAEAVAGSEPPDAAPTASTAPLARSAGLRDAARQVLAAWDDITGERAGLAAAIERLRAALPPARAPRESGAARTPRSGTKQQTVLALLRRAEGASGPDIIAATGWQPHTVRGFLAGLKKRGIEVLVHERVRQVGPGKEGAKGSYTVYRVAEAG
jgi:hypothetical protein